MGELEAVAGVLADPANAESTVEDVVERVLEALKQERRRPWRYVVIAQDRRRHYDLRGRFGTHDRSFYPTYVKGPFQTLAEARQAAGRERRTHPGVKVMTARVFDVEDDVDPDQLEEVLA